MSDSASDTHFHAVVIGSGFGGSVTAYRLAEAGLRICVLVRGKAYPPGEFPRAPTGCRGTSGTPARGCTGCTTSGRSAGWGRWSAAAWAGGH